MLSKGIIDSLIERAKLSCEDHSFERRLDPEEILTVLVEYRTLEAAEQDRAAVRKALENILIGGNSLASVLLNWGIFPERIESIEIASATLTYEQYEVWLCWKTMMDNRDVLETAEADQGQGKEG